MRVLNAAEWAVANGPLAHNELMGVIVVTFSAVDSKRSQLHRWLFRAQLKNVNICDKFAKSQRWPSA